MAESYDAGTVIIQTYSAGAITIRDYDAGTFVVPQGPSGPSLPAWLTHAFETFDITASDLDPIATWTDSVASASFTATGTQKPLYRSGAVPYLDWDGVDDYMVSTIGGAQPNTLILLCDPVIAGEGRFLLDGTGTTRNAVYIGASLKHYLFAGVAERDTGVVPTNTPQMMGGVFNGGSSFFRRNLTDTSVLTPGSNAFAALRIGRNLGAGALGFKGKLYGVFLAVGHAATAGELDDLYAYCDAKFPGVL
jgi:hypothetical protein